METLETYFAQQPQRQFTADEYQMMIDAGIIAEDEPVELLEGFLVARASGSPLRNRLIRRLNRHFSRALSDAYEVGVQTSLSLARSVPEPDLSIVRVSEVDTAPQHPRSAVLVIEVSASSLEFDRQKARIYAGAGIPEYWIVNVHERCVEVYLRPDRERAQYASKTVVEAGAVSPKRLRCPPVKLAELFRYRSRQRANGARYPQH
ncbi:MAG: Uma2 family endonuclease [Myxococcales bacterium]|nr:Uma2 family endonuclease [Myxococcales bacterium]